MKFHPQLAKNELKIVFQKTGIFHSQDLSTAHSSEKKQKKNKKIPFLCLDVCVDVAACSVAMKKEKKVEKCEEERKKLYS